LPRVGCTVIYLNKKKVGKKPTFLLIKILCYLIIVMMNMVMVKTILSFEKKSPEARPHVIKGIMNDILEI